MQQVTWSVGLSDGTNRQERTIPTQGKSPWLTLLDELKDSGTHITSLSLSHTDGRRYTLPSAGSNPKFRAFVDAPKPTGYRFFRKVGVDVLQGEQDTFSVIAADYADSRSVELWVCNRTGATWCLLR